MSRDELSAHVHQILATPRATDAWKTEQIVDWLWQRRVTLCSHNRPAWSCIDDCPALQAALSRAQRAERALTEPDAGSPQRGCNRPLSEDQEDSHR